MEKVVIFVIIALACLSCKTENQKPPFPSFPPEDTVVNVKFDFEAFNKHRRLWKEKYGWNKLPSGTYYINSDNRYVTQDSSSTGYRLHVFRGIYGDYYCFSLAGKLKIRGFFFTNDGRRSLFDVGNVYFFDEQGKLDSVGNYDINYKFNTDSVIAFLQERGLKVWDRFVDIDRGEEPIVGEVEKIGPWEGSGKYRWRLKYMLPGTKELRRVELDAKTGAVLVDSVIGVLNE